MARSRGWTWTVIISLLVGAVGASIFWLYSPYGTDQLAQQVAEDLKSRKLPVELKGDSLKLPKLAAQATGAHFQMVAGGKEVFLVDLKNGRVWRYFHQTKEGGLAKEDEGFLPLGMYYGGKKHYSAAEIGEVAASPGAAPRSSSGGTHP